MVFNWYHAHNHYEQDSNSFVIHSKYIIKLPWYLKVENFLKGGKPNPNQPWHLLINWSEETAIAVASSWGLVSYTIPTHYKFNLRNMYTWVNMHFLSNMWCMKSSRSYWSQSGLIWLNGTKLRFSPKQCKSDNTTLILDSKLSQTSLNQSNISSDTSNIWYPCFKA